MLSTLIFSSVILMPVLWSDVSQDLAPELPDWQLKYSHSNGRGSLEAMFGRMDNATISISTAVFDSAAKRAQNMSAIEDNLQVRPAERTTEYKALRSSLSGNPLGDSVYKFENPTSGTIQLYVGAENVSASVTLRYRGSGKPGAIRWEIGDLQQDRIVVEDVARGLIGKLLASQHFPSLQKVSAGHESTKLEDRARNSYVSATQWATQRGLNPTSVRKVGIAFSYKGRSVEILVGSNHIKVGRTWVAIGATILEIDGKPYLAAQALENALK